MSYTPVTVDDFKSRFARDFPFGDNASVVMDSDITNALNMAGVNFNEALWDTQATFAQMYLLLAAHFLVLSIRASSAGLNSQFSGLTASKGVGNVNEAYVIPDRVKNSPFLMGLYSTDYGAQYVTLLWPVLTGNVATIRGNTTP